MVISTYNSGNLENNFPNLCITDIQHGYLRKKIVFNTGEINLAIIDGELYVSSSVYLPGGRIQETYRIKPKRLRKDISPLTALNRATSGIVGRLASLKGVSVQKINYPKPNKSIPVRNCYPVEKSLESVLGFTLDKVGVAG
jgi:hypothetical protein